MNKILASVEITQMRNRLEQMEIEQMGIEQLEAEINRLEGKEERIGRKIEKMKIEKTKKLPLSEIISNNDLNNIIEFNREANYDITNLIKTKGFIDYSKNFNFSEDNLNSALKIFDNGYFIFTEHPEKENDIILSGLLLMKSDRLSYSFSIEFIYGSDIIKEELIYNVIEYNKQFEYQFCTIYAYPSDFDFYYTIGFENILDIKRKLDTRTRYYFMIKQIV